MTRQRTIQTSGELARTGHTLLTRAILKDHGVEVESVGSSFYNANNFAHIYFIFALGDWVKGGKDPRGNSTRIWSDAQYQMKGENKIVIARTPDTVTEEYLRVLDGGILHESFHSLYTTQRLSTYVMDRALDKYYRPHPLFAKKIGFLKTLWNVFEDGMIERRGIEAFEGAQTNLNFTARMVWQMERESRPTWNMVSHFTCYLRDRVKNHLEKPPLSEYDPAVAVLTEQVFGDLILQGNVSKDSQECFELALQAYLRFLNLEDELDSRQESNDDQSEDDQSEDDAEEGSSSESSGEEGDSESSEQGEGEPTEGDADADAESAGEGTSEETGEEGDGVDNQSVMEAARKLTDEMLEGEEPEPVEVGDVINQQWKEATGEVPATVFPYNPNNDEVLEVTPSEWAKGEYKRIAASVRADTVAIRAKILRYLRGEKKVRRVHRQETGRRLGRNITDIITHKKPKPFQRRMVTEAQNTAVSVVMDESTSMRDEKEAARYMLITFSELFKEAGIPFEVVGFTTARGSSGIRERELEGLSREVRDAKVREITRRFTRTSRVRFRIFRTFDEPTRPENLSKLSRTDASGSTPLCDGLDFAARRMLERTEDRRLIIIVTDGEQTASDCMSAEQLIAITNSQVALLKKAGVECLFVGYGKTAAKYVHKYENHIHVETREEFALKVNDYIYRKLQGKTHGH